ncbi:MAG: VCBS repeat-containing protein [Flavobacteriaceae bacterium]|nr:VCBS repeat-containing protein [Flavobacteriaceae bacterium]
MKRVFMAFMVVVICLSCSNREPTLFSLLSPSKTGIKFQNLLQENEAFNVLNYGYLYNGGGVAVGDVNNDGLEDIYFTGNMVASRLYLNQGNLNFKEVAAQAGVEAAGYWNTGTVMVDINADGWLDIFVCRSAAKTAPYRQNLLFINNQDGTFTEMAEDLGLLDTGYTTNALFFDMDRDNDLDLYLLNHSVQEYAGFDRLTGELKNKVDPNYGDKLYENIGGFFFDITLISGIKTNVLGFGLGVVSADFNEDGWPDIYVSNDYNEEDYLYINNQDRTFTESLRDYMDYTPLFSMGSDVADINNDGSMDIVALDMLPESQERQKMVLGPDNYEKHSQLTKTGFHHQYMRNMLQVNQSGQFFSEVGQFSGISNTDWSWAALVSDFDNDGWNDLFVTNGYKRDYTNMDFISYAVQQRLNQQQNNSELEVMNLINEIPSSLQENYIYRQVQPLQFEKMNRSWGFDHQTLSNGAVYSDLDNDGDLDLVVNNIEKPASIYRNNSEKLSTNHSLSIQLLDTTSLNREGIGAHVTVYSGENSFHRLNQPVRGFQSSVSRKLHFGLGQNEVIDSITIQWPDGQFQNLMVQESVSKLTIEKAQNLKSSMPSESHPIIFSKSEDTGLESIVHQENEFVDFKRERLLPFYLSTKGPQIAIGDINQDQQTDIYLVGAKGTSGQLLVQNSNGKFQQSNNSIFEQIVEKEQTAALFFDADGDGDADLYTVSGGNENQGELLQDRMYINQNGQLTNALTSLPLENLSGSCVVSSDIDHDGDLDLFVGTFGMPGQYPLSNQSQLLINDGNGFFELENHRMPQQNQLGKVSDALFYDIDQNGFDDLIVVGHWMKPQILLNTDGLFSWMEAPFLENLEGFWNSIEQADVNNDGQMDFLLGNLGLNSQLKSPVKLFYKDFDNNGALDPILCVYENERWVPFISKDDIQSQITSLKSKYVSYASYADQSMNDIFSESELSDAQELDIREFSSGILLSNKGSGYSFVPYPKEAQLSPIYAQVLLDFNEDGHIDLITGGNLFGTRVKLGRFASSKGELFEGDGTGQFKPVDYSKSGLFNRGEIRDMKLVKIRNQWYLIVARNNTNLNIFSLDFPISDGALLF